MGKQKKEKYSYPVRDTFLEEAKIIIANDIIKAGGASNTKCSHVRQAVAPLHVFWLSIQLIEIGW